MFQKLDRPWLDGGNLPENEQGAVSHFESLLSDLISFCEAFQDDFVLYANSRGLQDQEGSPNYVRSWMFIAGRDGAMTLYHFAQTLSSIRGSFGSCPTFRATVDHPAIRQAEKDLKAAFPAIDALRNAVAHWGELDKNPAEAQRHYVGNIKHSSNFQGDAFIFSFEGEIVDYHLTDASALAINDIARRVLSAFPNSNW